MYFGDKVGIVTGASQGIGKGIAESLAKKGVKLCLGSRRPNIINDIFSEIVKEENLMIQKLDLANSSSIQSFLSAANKRFQFIDFCIHCAGIYESGRFEEVPAGRVDELLSVNLKGAHTLFSCLLPYFKKDFSQLVVVNSSTAINTKAEKGLFSATTHGLRALTETFRNENNDKGIRVAGLYLGRTATPRMEEIYKKKGELYQKELLLQPEDVARSVLHILSMPRNAEITDLSIRPFVKSYSNR